MLCSETIHEALPKGASSVGMPTASVHCGSIEYHTAVVERERGVCCGQRGLERSGYSVVICRDGCCVRMGNGNVELGVAMAKHFGVSGQTSTPPPPFRESTQSRPIQISRNFISLPMVRFQDHP